MPTPTPVILITGGTGFAGSHLVEAVLAAQIPVANLHVTNFVNKPSFVDTLLPKANIHQLDLTDTEGTFALFKKLQPTQIYHLAGFAATSLSLDKAKQVIDTNVAIQLNVLEAMREHTPQARLLYVGSAAEYAPSNQPINELSQLGPHDPYGVSKVAQDMLAHSYAARYKLDIVRVRPFNHIGERQEPGFVVSDFARQIVAIEKGQQKTIQVGNLTTSRDFSDVKDIVQAYLLLMAKGQTGEVYNLGSGQSVTIEELLNRLAKLSKVEIKIEADQSKMRPGEIKQTLADTAKIRALGWQASIPLDQTLERILHWWRTQN